MLLLAAATAPTAAATSHLPVKPCELARDACLVTCHSPRVAEFKCDATGGVIASSCACVGGGGEPAVAKVEGEPTAAKLEADGAPISATADSAPHSAAPAVHTKVRVCCRQQAGPASIMSRESCGPNSERPWLLLHHPCRARRWHWRPGRLS